LASTASVIGSSWAQSLALCVTSCATMICASASTAIWASALACRIFSARRLLVGDPVRHFVATLVVAMQLVLFGVRRFGGAEPTGNLGFQVPFSPKSGRLSFL
jgi:hypothetical protein